MKVDTVLSKPNRNFALNVELPDLFSLVPVVKLVISNSDSCFDLLVSFMKLLSYESVVVACMLT